jgi:non-homologous end joining protein Ku
MAGLKVTVQLGLLSIACKSESAIEKPEDPKNLCVGQPGKPKHDPSPSMAPPTCGVCGPITDRGALVKGFKQGDGTFALVSQEDIAEAKEAYAREYKGKLSLVPHPAQQFMADTGPGDTLNFLTPADAGSADHYQLIVKLVEENPQLVFASLHTPRSATSQYMLRVKDGVLMMEKRTRTQNLKPAPSVGGTVNEALYAQLVSMLPMFITDYDPAAYEDKYLSALSEMIASAEQVSAMGTEPTAAPVMRVSDDELMAKLQALAGTKTKKPAKKAAKKKEVAAA